MRLTEFTGTWRQEIPEMRGELGKTDIVLCEHKEDRLSGTIRRLLPESERFKRWSFEARIRKGLVFGTFWPSDEDKNPKNYGTLHLNMISDTYLEGFLVELFCTDHEGEHRFTGEITHVPTRWIRNQG